MSSRIIKVAIAHVTVLVGAGGARAIAFLTSIILARALGAHSFGQFSLFQSTMFICWQIPQAFDTAFIRYAKSEDSKEHVRQCLAAATRLKIFFSGIALAAAYPICLIVNSLNPEDASLGKLAAAGIVCGSLICFMSSIANVMRVKEQFARFSIVQGLYNLTIFIAVLVLAYLLKNINLTNTIASVMAIAVLYGIGSLAILYKTAGSPFKAPAELNKLIFSLAKWILPTVACYYAFARIDILLLSSAIPFDQVGIYSAAGQLILIVNLTISSVSAVFMPRSVSAVKSRAGVIDYCKEAVIPICIIFAAIVFLFIAAPYIFAFLFTPEYGASAGILRILLCGYIFVAVYTPLSFLFYALNRPEIRFYLEAFKLLLAITLLFFIIPAYGTSGAAWAMCVSMATASILSSLVLFKLLKKSLAM